ncbi:MAG: DUF3365 domain-containing protein [Spirulinaceae cyanobacterium]
MSKLVSRLILSCCAIATIWLYQIQVAQAAVDPAELSKAVEEIEYLDATRSGLASSLEGRTEPPTKQTMQEVCKPVGMRAKQLSVENNWQVKQIATKYRNPNHAPQSETEENALALFEQNPDLIGFWQKDVVAGEMGDRYFRRINVESSCLACHGAKNSRPDFVKANYPDDRAFNFQVGDLRGMYSVFVPEVQAGLKAALQ